LCAGWCLAGWGGGGGGGGYGCVMCGVGLISFWEWEWGERKCGGGRHTERIWPNSSFSLARTHKGNDAHVPPSSQAGLVFAGVDVTGDAENRMLRSVPLLILILLEGMYSL
jgi:hypothetical protein